MITAERAWLLVPHNATMPTVSSDVMQTYNPLPIPATALPVACAVTTTLNYTDASNADGLSPPLFAMAGRNVDFSLRITGTATQVPRSAPSVLTALLFVDYATCRR